MKTPKSLVNLVALCTLIGCSDQYKPTIDLDIPRAVTLRSDEAMELNEVPLEIFEIIDSLKFNEAYIVQKPLGYPAHEKIKSFNVTAYVEYDDGWLIASGRGEWGGIVFWLSHAGDYNIIRDDDLAHPIDLIVERNTIFISQGMPHAHIDGHLLEITRSNGSFETSVYPIEGTPHSFDLRDDQWTISQRPFGDEYYIISELQAGKLVLHNKFTKSR